MLKTKNIPNKLFLMIKYTLHTKQIYTIHIEISKNSNSEEKMFKKN